MQDPAHPPAPAEAETLDIIGHVSNSSLDHPLIHLPPVFGIDLSVTKHVFMLWVVAAILFVVVTAMVRRYMRQQRLVPTGPMNVLELGVEFIRDERGAAELGGKWTNVWTPLLLTFFFFILGREPHRPDSDFRCAGARRSLRAARRRSIRSSSGSCTAARRRPATPNVTAGLAVVTLLRDHHRPACVRTDS